MQRGLSNVEYSAVGLPANVLRRNNEYVLCWQQQQEFNEDVEDEVRRCKRFPILKYRVVHLLVDLGWV